MIKWKRLGRIFFANGQHEWMQTHTAAPVPLQLDESRYRIFFGTRDRENHPQIGFVEIDIDSPEEILRVSAEPVLWRGPRGHFDDNGMYPGTVIADQGRLLMYYSGRSNGVRPLYYMSIGLAASEDEGLTFQRIFQAPMIARSEFDPWMVSMPFVRREGDLWRMWYMSGMKWDEDGDQPHSYYDIKYAESADGVNWQRDGLVCIGLREGETNIAGPTVVRDDSGYRMWYSYVAGAGYRVGYAESEDGRVWIRKDSDAGIDLSTTGWDSEAMAYPYVFVHGGIKYLLYSGNGFGRAGFGLATEE